MLALLHHTAAGLAELRHHWRGILLGAPDSAPTRLVEAAPSAADPGNLRMLYHLPADLPRRAPLVVALHGCAQTASAYDRGTGWSQLADEHGFAVLFPEQKRINNAYCCFDWFEPHDAQRDRGEALSIRRMIERMLVEHDLDASRVYVTGLSAGGAMASVMLATYPELFAGGAILAGLPYRSATSAREAMSSMAEGPSRSASEWGDLVRMASAHAGPGPLVSVWHGDADTTVAPSNAEEVVKQWLDLHGLDPKPAAQEIVDGGATRRVWRDARRRDVVEIYRVPGLDHAVPIRAGDGWGRYGAAGPFMADVGISSTWHIARFWGLTKARHRQIVIGPAVAARVAGLAAQIGGAVRGLGKRSGIGRARGTRPPMPAVR